MEWILHWPWYAQLLLVVGVVVIIWGDHLGRFSDRLLTRFFFNGASFDPTAPRVRLRASECNGIV